VIRWITCREFVDFLDDYLARRLEPPQVAEFNNHLSGCPPCVAYMQTYEDSIRLGKAAMTRSEEPTPDAVPEDLVAAILAAREKVGS
jgi:anti-sigma factor RsiW